MLVVTLLLGVALETAACLGTTLATPAPVKRTAARIPEEIFALLTNLRFVVRYIIFPSTCLQNYQILSMASPDETLVGWE